LIGDTSFIIARGGRDLANEPMKYVRLLRFGDHAIMLIHRRSNAK